MLRRISNSSLITRLPQLRHQHRYNMPAFTLYGVRGSGNTDRVRLLLAEAGFTDYELVQLDFAKREHKSPEHLARHPWGKVPVAIFPDGLTLYESRAITKYLARKYDIPLLPPATDVAALARFDQAECEEIFYFYEPAARLSVELYAKKKFLGLPSDENVVAAARKGIEAALDVADGVLQKQQYMVGDAYSLVDINYIPMINRLFVLGHGDIVTSRPAVAAWWARCNDRPAVKQVLPAD